MYQPQQENSDGALIIITLGIIAVLLVACVAGASSTQPDKAKIEAQQTMTTLPLSCLGDDYLMFKNFNGDPSAWDSELHWFTHFHCTGARLGFSFADESNKTCSTYTYAKMNSVLNKLNSVGVKAVICEFAGSNTYFYGSAEWIADWEQVASDFEGDPRIAAFEIANEPYAGYLAPGSTTLSGFDASCASCIDAIRAIDPTRTIMYPIVDVILTDSATDFYNDLVAKGIPAKGNILYDIVHPYYYQNVEASDGGYYGDPAGKADFYWYNYVLPQISYLGAANVWCGETFCWPRSEGYIYADQQTFEKRFINYCVGANMGFQMWDFFSASDQQAQVDALTNSNYMGHVESGISIPVVSSNLMMMRNR